MFPVAPLGGVGDQVFVERYHRLGHILGRGVEAAEDSVQREHLLNGVVCVPEKRGHRAIHPSADHADGEVLRGAFQCLIKEFQPLSAVVPPRKPAGFVASDESVGTAKVGDNLDILGIGPVERRQHLNSGLYRFLVAVAGVVVQCDRLGERGCQSWSRYADERHSRDSESDESAAHGEGGAGG